MNEWHENDMKMNEWKILKKGQLPDSAVSADAAAAPAVGAAGSVVAAVAAGPTVGCAVGGQPVNKQNSQYIIWKLW